MGISVKNFGDYHVKNVKTFVGMEGEGFNANLYRGKKLVAFVIDNANGGEANIQWNDRSEEQLLRDHVATLPKVPSQIQNMQDLTIDMSWFVTDCVHKFLNDKDIAKMQKKCQSKTMYRHKSCKFGQYYIWDVVYSEKVAQALKTKHGADVEIFNEVFAQGKIPSVLA
jgi:hypothetical protein